MAGANTFSLWRLLTNSVRGNSESTNIAANGIYEISNPEWLDSRNPVSLSIVCVGSTDPIGAVVTAKLRRHDGEIPDDIAGASLTLPTMASGVVKYIPQSFRPRGRLCIEVASLPTNAVISVAVAQ